MMPMPTTLDCPHPNTERIRKQKDGSIVLSISQDRVCKLNGVGALTWMILEDIPASLSLDEIVRALEQQFEAINSEGEFLYQVSQEQLRADTERFLNNMASLGLVGVSQDSHGQTLYVINSDVSSTTSAPVTPIASSQQIENAGGGIEEAIRFSKRETFSAFVGLLAFDLLLKIAGFQSLIKKVENWPTAEPRTTNREICQRVRGMVDRAQMYYPKKAMCLQHSAVVTCLLRRRGVPAEMVVGAQEFPPKAHAWSEVLNEVVSDSPRVKIKYRELRRL
jgi:Transglutaminase-like superfamily/Coenzyme PQQ synthesis protein D (PqqD)